MISITLDIKDEDYYRRKAKAPDFIGSNLDFNFLEVMSQRRKENLIYEIEDLNRKQTRACHVIEIIYYHNFPIDKCENKIPESHMKTFEILVQGIPVNKSNSQLSIDNVTWIGAGSELDNIEAVYEVDSTYYHLDLLQCRQIWGIPPNLQLNKENKVLRTSHNGQIISTPIVPQGYFDFLLERDRRLKEIMQMFEVGGHPMFIRCHEVLEFFEKYQSYIFIITDNLEDCTLRDHLSSFKRRRVRAINADEDSDDSKTKWSECDQIKDFIYRILAGLTYWHDRGKGHKDIRPENIIMKIVDTGFDIPKLINFGLSSRFREEDFDGEVDYSNSLFYPIGTVEYSPCDSRTDENYSDMKADIFSVGVTLFEYLNGARPFKSCVEGHKRYMESPLTKWFLWHYQDWALANFNPTLPSSDPSNYYGAIFTNCTHISDDAKNLIAKMLYPDPTQRPTAREAMQHPWFDSLGRNYSDVEEDDTDVKSVDIVNIGFHPIIWMDGSRPFSDDLNMTILDTLSSGDNHLSPELCYSNNNNRVVPPGESSSSSSLLNVYTNLYPYFIRGAFATTDELEMPPTVMTCLFRTAEQHEHYMQAKKSTSNIKI